ncbi:MAG: hypothetical protein ACLUR5_14585 [Eubacterium ventriosum]
MEAIYFNGEDTRKRGNTTFRKRISMENMAVMHSSIYFVLEENNKVGTKK